MSYIGRSPRYLFIHKYMYPQRNHSFSRTLPIISYHTTAWHTIYSSLVALFKTVSQFCRFYKRGIVGVGSNNRGTCTERCNFARTQPKNYNQHPFLAIRFSRNPEYHRVNTTLIRCYYECWIPTQAQLLVSRSGKKSSIAVQASICDSRPGSNIGCRSSLITC